MNSKNFQFDKWHGIDRTSIDWQPKIDESKCIGCGFCVTTCGRQVYKYDYKNRKSKVVNPHNCMVACQTCANLCPAKTISFAKEDKTREKAQKIVKDFQLIPKVEEELEVRKNELNFEDYE